MKLPVKKLALLILPLATQSFSAEIESLTVTGSRSQATEFIAQSILTRDQIDSINPQSTVELMQQIPNITVSSDGIAGRSHISIRGGEPNFTLVMIDGVVVNDPTNSSGGGFDFNQLDPVAIERIEVYRGGISAVYGGDALSGVVHFITRQADISSLSLEVGTDQLRRGNLSFSQQLNDDTSVLFSLSANKQQVSDFSEYENQQALLKLNTRITNSEHQLLFSASATDRQAFAENSGGDLYADPYQAELRESEHWLASWSGQYYLDENKNLHTRFSWTRNEEFSDHPGIVDGVISGIPASMITSEYKKLDADLYMDWLLAEDFSVLGGVNLKQAEGSNEGTLDFGFPLPASFELQQESYSAFVEVTKKIADWQFDLGLRYDAPSDFDEELSSRLSLSYQLNTQARIQASYSEGYKLPSIFALVHPLVGNPNLRPELSQNSELSIAYESDSGYQLEMSIFYNQFEDLVAFSPVLFTNINQSKVNTSGVEFLLSKQVNDWFGYSLDINYLDTDVIGSAEQAKRRPGWSGALRLYADVRDFNFNFLLASRSDFFDTSVPTGELSLPGYTNVDFNARWYWRDDLNFTFSLDNLFDKNYQPAVGFLDSGRQARFGIQYQL